MSSYLIGNMEEKDSAWTTRLVQQWTRGWHDWRLWETWIISSDSPCTYDMVKDGLY